MAKLKFSLEPKGPKRLIIAFEGNFESSVFALDGVELVRIDGKQRLLDGVTLSLPDGRVLNAQLAPGVLYRFDLSIDGRPLPGTLRDIDFAVDNTLTWIRWLVGWRVAFLAWDYVRSDEPWGMFGVIIVSFPMVLAVLAGLAVWRRRPTLALVLVIATAVAWVLVDWLSGVPYPWVSALFAALFIGTGLRAHRLIQDGRLASVVTAIGSDHSPASVPATRPEPTSARHD